jgi:hypothetical protein
MTSTLVPWRPPGGQRLASCGVANWAVAVLATAASSKHALQQAKESFITATSGRK